MNLSAVRDRLKRIEFVTKFHKENPGKKDSEIIAELMITTGVSYGRASEYIQLVKDAGKW